jgi:hypothetical protein
VTILIEGLPMQVNSSSCASAQKESDRNRWKEFVLSGLVIILVLVVWNAWKDYDDKHSIRSSVTATVEERRLFSGGGHGGGIGAYNIKVTLQDGSKVSVSAPPTNPEPPEAGQKINVIKIISAIGFTSYCWDRPFTWNYCHK